MSKFFEFNKEIKTSSLENDIISSGLGPVYEHVHKLAVDIVRIAMSDSVTPSEEALLSGVVDAHKNIALPKLPETSGVFVNTINNLSGLIEFISVNDGLTVIDNENIIKLDALFTTTSGVLLNDVVLQIDSIISAGSGTSVELFFTPTSGIEFVLHHGLNTDIWTWNMWRTDTSPICSVLPRSISPSGINHVIVKLAGPAFGRLILTAGGQGPSGVQGPQGPQGSPGISVNKITLSFTTISGIEFILEHGLQSEDFIANMYRTDISPVQRIVPCSMAPSGADHIIIKIATPMDGKIVLIC